MFYPSTCSAEIEAVDFRRYVETLPLPISQQPGGTTPFNRRARLDRAAERKRKDELRNSVKDLERWGPGLDPNPDEPATAEGGT